MNTQEPMFSTRFDRQMIVTRHARQRMAERNVSDELLLRIIDTGGVRYRDASHLWSLAQCAWQE